MGTQRRDKISSSSVYRCHTYPLPQTASINLAERTHFCSEATARKLCETDRVTCTMCLLEANLIYL